MKSQLRLAPHSVLPGEQAVEVFYNGRLLCTVAGADGPGIRIITKHHVLARRPGGVMDVLADAAEPGDANAVEIIIVTPP